MLGLDTVQGLPVHVLLVHAAVILVPLSVLFLIATQWRPDWRDTLSIPVVLLSVAGALSAFMAAESGGALRNTVRDAALKAGTRADFGDHPGNGGNAEIAAMIFGVSAVGLFIVERWGPRLNLPAKAPDILYGVSSLLGLVSVVLVILAGHSGSALVWKDLGNFVHQS